MLKGWSSNSSRKWRLNRTRETQSAGCSADVDVDEYLGTLKVRRLIEILGFLMNLELACSDVVDGTL